MNKKHLGIGLSVITLCISVVVGCFLWQQKQGQEHPQFKRATITPSKKSPERQKFEHEGMLLAEYYMKEIGAGADVDRAKKELALNPKNEVALRTMAKAAYISGYYNEAIGIYKKLIEINPKNTFHYLQCGSCYRYIGDNASAIPLFEKAVSMGGYMGENARERLKDIKINPNLLQSDCQDCTKK